MEKKQPRQKNSNWQLKWSPQQYNITQMNNYKPKLNGKKT